MIWLTWRQFRAQAWVALGLLAVVAVILAATGTTLVSVYNETGIGSCAAQGDCESLGNAFMSKIGSNGLNTLYDTLRALAFALPALIGMFWGAPLITRELEAGTLPLAWNQSVTRVRWALVKVGLVALASMAFAGLFSLALTWWSSPINQAMPQRMVPATFGVTGIVPIGYAAFAFTLGVTIGLLVRRTVPAMALTLAAVGAFQAAMVLWIRARLITPDSATIYLNPGDLNDFIEHTNGSFSVVPAPPPIPGAWIISSPRTIDTPAHVVTQACGKQLQEGLAQPTACTSLLAKLHLHEVVTYQPDSRFWALQGVETGILIVLAVALVGACYWRIRCSIG
jgi:hypothetical protein